MVEGAPQLLPPAGGTLIVTGGCGGIGRVLVDRAVAAGLGVTVLDLPQAINAHPRDDAWMIPADLGDPSQVADAFHQIAGRNDAIDGFVSLAGFSNDPAPLMDLSVESWDEAIAGNLRSVYLACRSALRCSGDLNTALLSWCRQGRASGHWRALDLMERPRRL